MDWLRDRIADLHDAGGRGSTILVVGGGKRQFAAGAMHPTQHNRKWSFDIDRI